MCKLLLKVLLYIVTCNGGSNGVTEIAAPLLILKKRGEVGGRGGERENLIVRYSYTSIMNKVLLQSSFYKIFLWCDAFPTLSEYSISDTYSMEFLHETRLKLTLDSDIHILALNNFLQISMESVYLNLNDGIRSFFHRVIHPFLGYKNVIVKR